MIKFNNKGKFILVFPVEELVLLRKMSIVKIMNRKSGHWTG